MVDYYIRTPEQDESRGPFNMAKLITLAEAGQVTEDTFYYDEDKEEWVPIALNEALKAAVFPKAESLKLSIGTKSKVKTDSKDSKDEEEEEDDDVGGISIQDLLAAAEGDTEETRHLKRTHKSFEQAVAMASMGLGLMMLLSAISFLVPQLSVVQGVISEQFYIGLLNYPFLLIAVFDLIMAVLLLLSVTDIFPLIRGRSMLGLGFGVYVGWALGDPIIMAAFGLGGAGLFLGTISHRISLMLLAIVAGIGGNGALAYLAINGRFDEFYSTIQLNLFSQ